MSGIYLGVKTPNQVIGITSTNPGTANAMLANQQPQAVAQNAQQPVAQASRWSNQPPTVVHEIPWHKAHPGLKDIK